ncbi:uncharacterized protein TNCV_1872581 [Trichonephila clavipes]|nr:uncharacterized protein TNCV_1872581 [Trichonephila clavipes]
MGSNLGEGMDVCKCIVPSRHGDTLNNRRAASPLVRLVEGVERGGKAPSHSKDVVPQNCSRTEQNRTVTCMVLKAKANDRRKNLALRRDKFREPLIWTGGISNNNTALAY